MEMKKYRKGSLTVEASAVVPLVLMVLFLTIYLCYYVHNRSWFFSAAAESALCGSQDGRQAEAMMYRKAKVRSQELSSQGVWGRMKIQTYVEVQDSVRVCYQLEPLGQVFGFPTVFKEEASSRIFRPTEQIRQRYQSQGQSSLSSTENQESGTQ